MKIKLYQPLFPIVFLGLLAPAAYSDPAINQETDGPCSPNVAGVGGNVSVNVNCSGVPPDVMKWLITQLNEKHQNELDRIIQEANEWAKKYHNLREQLAELGLTNERTKQAQQMLDKGDFDKAGKILDELLAKDELEVDQIADRHFTRAQLYDLEFKLKEALPHYEKAYRYRPGNRVYASAYAVGLHGQNEFAQARRLFEEILARDRELAKANPAEYQPDVAATLSNLASIYSTTQRFTDALQAYQEALGIWRELAQAQFLAYSPGLAATLSNLGNLYSTTRQLSEAEVAYQEALGVWRDLVKVQPLVFQPMVATSLNNLASLYSTTQRFIEAEHSYQEALKIRRELARTHPVAYQPDVAESLHNLASVYSTTQRFIEAERAYLQSLKIRRDLARVNPPRYQRDLSDTLNDLASLYGTTQRFIEAEHSYQEALRIRRELARTHPAAYQPDVAATLTCKLPRIEDR